MHGSNFSVLSRKFIAKNWSGNGEPVNNIQRLHKSEWELVYILTGLYTAHNNNKIRISSSTSMGSVLTQNIIYSDYHHAFVEIA